MTDLAVSDSTIDTGEATIHVEQAGSGLPAIVFLHYWGGSARTWHLVISRLHHSARCVALDQRGWGRSRTDEGTYATADFADDAQAVIAALKLEEYVIVGHSMGGKVAQLIASRRPDGLRGLVLVAPAPARPLPVSEDFREQLRGAYATRESVIAGMDGVIHQQLSDAIREQVVEDSLGGSPGAKQAWPDYTIVEDVSENLENIDVPVLVLSGQQDEVEPAETLRSQIVANIATATLEIVPDSGHFIPLERPDFLSDRIAAFCEAVRTS
ncbi:alpha/beta fold hydrolase [Microbacterium sp. RD1]|uniref:alpha/beta fold hydrolase n=1 Tax=Microbacterium sp. RD1 TaxID=3457313 RepID=UPI003FA5B076